MLAGSKGKSSTTACSDRHFFQIRFNNLFSLLKSVLCTEFWTCFLMIIAPFWWPNKRGTISNILLESNSFWFFGFVSGEFVRYRYPTFPIWHGSAPGIRILRRRDQRDRARKCQPFPIDPIVLPREGGIWISKILNRERERERHGTTRHNKARRGLAKGHEL
jgi:hypothetical protein